MTAPHALVAGASRGLGLLIAGELLDRGYRVTICARDGKELAAAVSTLRQRGDVTSHSATLGAAIRWKPWSLR